jgi:glucose/arabinose dehydrogenase
MRASLLGLVLLVLAGCGEQASLPVSAGTGPSPQLPPPKSSWIPTVNIAPARGWPEGTAPTPAEGLRVQSFAAGLDHPRWLHVLPNGDVLVAETNAPPKPGDSGIRSWVMRRVMARAGAGVPSANRITLLRDADGDGVAETRSVFLEGLNSPFGMALVGENLSSPMPMRSCASPTARARRASPRPARCSPPSPAARSTTTGTKNIVASADGTKLYASIGSNSNVAERGL